MEFDLGGIAKGYAVDQAAEIMRADGVTAALISSGTSSIYALGIAAGRARVENHRARSLP